MTWQKSLTRVAPLAETVGERVFKIRQALRTDRDPLPLEEFGELIYRTTGFRIDKYRLSRIETGKEKRIDLPTVQFIAAVDPYKRGPVWLAGWEDQGGGDVPVTGTPDAPQPVNGSPTRRFVEVPVDVETFHRPARKQPARRRRPKDDRTAIAS